MIRFTTHTAMHGTIPVLLTQLKQEFEAQMEWGESQMGRGKDKAAEPCAQPGCVSFPTCCKTTTARRLDLDITSRVIP